MVGAAVSAVTTGIAVLQAIQGEEFWMWLCFAALALVAASFYSYHQARVKAVRKAEELPERLNELIREGVDLLHEARKPRQPERSESGTVRIDIGPDLKTADLADDFYERAWKVLHTHQPALLFDFVETINETRKEIRERWDDKRRRKSSESLDQLALFTEMVHQEPADYLEAFVKGLRAAQEKAKSVN